MLVFETHPLLTPWLCYHARHNDVYFDGRLISDSPVPLVALFSKIPDLANIDYVATRDRLIDLKLSDVSCVSFIDDTRGEDLQDGHVRYWLGPPAGLRSLTLQALSANLKMSLAPGPEATTLRVDYFLADARPRFSRRDPGTKCGDQKGQYSAGTLHPAALRESQKQRPERHPDLPDPGRTR